ATFSTKDLAPDALLLALTEDGAAVAPMTVGDSPKNLWVRDLVAIETSLAPPPAAQEASAFRLELDVNGTSASFALAELEKTDLYLEQKGSYTTSAGTRYSGIYGGARLRALLERYTKLSPEDSVKFVAMDGYEMTYPGSLVLDEKDGAWILAWKLDGEYLPKDPGYVRTVKVGAGDPNIDGHLSVRMVKKLVVKQKDFKDFSLSLDGKLRWELDRSTVQSCVSCHKRTVTFEKKGKVDTYTGFPAWLALGYVDDPKYAPHKQDKSFVVYDREAAAKGYPVGFAAADGFSISLDSRDLDRNDDVIIAMYKNDASLPDDEFPLTLVWDKDAKRIPAGIKNIRMLKSMKATF
ncbi:MAG: molybdopterin-dependent oxidoreductase, partial [Spirochaetaceae bacterium]|nr:molybdopterin-dependent oxidoreductase [Spirochaetaceae bacterium]